MCVCLFVHSSIRMYFSDVPSVPHEPVNVLLCINGVGPACGRPCLTPVWMPVLIWINQSLNLWTKSYLFAAPLADGVPCGTHFFTMIGFECICGIFENLLLAEDDYDDMFITQESSRIEESETSAVDNNSEPFLGFDQTDFQSPCLSILGGSIQTFQISF